MGVPAHETVKALMNGTGAPRIAIRRRRVKRSMALRNRKTASEVIRSKFSTAVERRGEVRAVRRAIVERAC